MARGSKSPNHKSPTAAVVIAAGGIGKRMHLSIPKQFLEISCKPVLLHTVEGAASLEEVVQIVIALPPEHIQMAESILRNQPANPQIQCVPGGSNRQESVRNGVAHVRQDVDVILVHDAVRPLCDRDLMLSVLNEAWEKGAAVPCLPATETIQQISSDGQVLETPPREELHAIQTPQGFHAGILRSALDRAHEEGFVGTDESSVVRRAGHPVATVPGSPENIKITRSLDLDIAELLISRRQQKTGEMGMHESRLRIGQGIDYHRLVEGRKLILGGVQIPFERGLEGHSDADVLSHAVCDAVLGAAGLGDIGQHFPDTDPLNRDRCSLDFLREVKAKVEAAGWMIRNVDATLLVQQPKLASHIPAIRQNIAESLGMDPAGVNIKATTTEGMNAEGRGEGMSAQSIALLCRK